MEQNFSVILYINESTNSALLKRSIESVLANTVRPTEILVPAFGNISSQIQNILDEFKTRINLRIFAKSMDYGRAFALQTAVSEASYELIALQDVNSFSFPGRFEKQITYFKENPETAVLGSAFEETDINSLTSKTSHKVPQTYLQIKKFLKTQCPFQHETVMFRKSAVLAAGNYQPFPFQLEDYYLWVRVIGNGCYAENLPDVLVGICKNPEMKWVCSAYHFFTANKMLCEKMKELNLLGIISYYKILTIRFIKYLLIPNWLRKIFYKEKWIVT